jgi:hypothetical protein
MQTRILNNIKTSVFVTGPKSSAHVTVINATEITETELLEIKRAMQNNYSVTEPMGTYFLLSIQALKFKTAMSEAEATQLYRTMLMKASEAWHDYYIASNN